VGAPDKNGVELVKLNADLYVNPKREHAPAVFVASKGSLVPQSVIDNAGDQAVFIAAEDGSELFEEVEPAEAPSSADGEGEGESEGDVNSDPEPDGDKAPEASAKAKRPGRGGVQDKALKPSSVEGKTTNSK